jgi:hypothetical protein
MSLLKSVLIKSVGVPAGFHTVTNVTFNKGSEMSNVAVASYFSQDVYAAGAVPLAQSNVVISGLPAAGQDMWEFADASLSKKAPADADKSAVIDQFQASPYAFAGATIV